MSIQPRINPKLAKFTHPSIEYILATAHYPEAFRRETRTYPQFFPAPPVQVFHVAQGHIPIFVPLPSERVERKAQPHKPQSRSKIFRFKVPSTPALGRGKGSSHNAGTSNTTSSPSDAPQTVALSPPPRLRNRPTRTLPTRKDGTAVCN